MCHHAKFFCLPQHSFNTLLVFRRLRALTCGPRQCKCSKYPSLVLSYYFFSLCLVGPSYQLPDSTFLLDNAVLMSRWSSLALMAPGQCSPRAPLRASCARWWRPGTAPPVRPWLPARARLRPRTAMAGRSSPCARSWRPGRGRAPQRVPARREPVLVRAVASVLCVAQIEGHFRFFFLS
jgi:hypothetical protein